jgi:hypothetical protein
MSDATDLAELVLAKVSRYSRHTTFMREVDTLARAVLELSEERDKLHQYRALHPYGACTCFGEGRCGWCERQNAIEERDAIHADWGAKCAEKAEVVDLYMAEREKNDTLSTEVEQLRGALSEIANQEIEGNPLSQWNMGRSFLIDIARAALSGETK